MTWDDYFRNICDVVASKSNCFSRKVGAVIVRDNSIISTGYNGPPRGVRHCDERVYLDKNLREKLGIKDSEIIHHLKYANTCPRKILGFKSGEGLEWCVAGHGERNAIVNAARLGVSVKGATMYMNCAIPCKDCLIEIINSGIAMIVVTEMSYYDMMSKYLMNESALAVRLYRTN